MNERLVFFKTFLKDRNIASVIPTSNFCVKKVCDKIDFKNKKVVLEYGPGTGVFTRYFLKRLTPDSTIIVFETNQNFISYLRRIKDNRLIIINSSAENAKEVLEKLNIKKVDCVISGIPFLFLEKKVRKKIIRDTKELLSNSGQFFIYQVSKSIYSCLKYEFKTIKFFFCFLNIPPLFIFEVRKNLS